MRAATIGAVKDSLRKLKACEDNVLKRAQLKTENWSSERLQLMREQPWQLPEDLRQQRIAALREVARAARLTRFDVVQDKRFRGFEDFVLAGMSGEDQRVYWGTSAEIWGDSPFDNQRQASHMGRVGIELFRSQNAMFENLMNENRYSDTNHLEQHFKQAVASLEGTVGEEAREFSHKLYTIEHRLLLRTIALGGKVPMLDTASES